MHTISILLVTTLVVLAPLSAKAKTISESTSGRFGPRVIMDMKKVRGLYYSPAPEYPKEALKKHWGGSGLFEVQCRRDGKVWAVFVTLSTGHKILDDATVAALHQWRSWKGYKLVVFAVPIMFDPGNRNRPTHEP